MTISQLTGSPWHTERAHRKEGEDKRSKKKCKFYKCEDKNCRKLVDKCIGSAHCNYYTEISEVEYKKRQEKSKGKKHKKNEDDDKFWY